MPRPTLDSAHTLRGPPCPMPWQHQERAPLPAAAPQQPAPPKEMRSTSTDTTEPPESQASTEKTEEWSVHLLPVQFLFLSVSPVIVMRIVSKSNGKEYPPHVPVKASSLLLMEVLALTVRGTLYPRPEGRKSLRGHVEITVGCNLPPVVALVPEGVIRGVAETVLKQQAEQMRQDLDTALAADFKRYRREKLTEKRTSA
ncbi:hypothetical protein GUJ93_ZPchr0006g40687 [Zizania palustris]|uniref:Uncharacterized protein n=1 Tax=Zizania palustris TaxID=103762 RepID=A0A8J5T4N1_ZIZPA|nr:hypothetical protein GUJ93_ZPchr0006g40687 [Zizania palustris]